MSVRARRALLIISAAAAFIAVLAGLARLGIHLSDAVAARAGEHGPLLVLGVFGSVIALERAVAARQSWAYVAPALGVVGAMAQLAGYRGGGAALACAAAAALVSVNALIVRRQAADFTWLMLLGSVVLALATSAWALGRPVFAVVPGWMAFFVLTIAAERLELSRLAPTPGWAKRLLAAISIVLAAAGLLAIEQRWAVRVLGGSLALTSAWQIRFDLARRTLRRPGLPRYAALGVLLGAAWLGVSGIGMATLGLPAAGPTYDAVLHGVFVGFVLSMVLAHAPIILPAVARLDLPFDAALYAPLALLHATLVARIAGDAFGIPGLRIIGGVGNAVALAAFVGAVLVARARRAGRQKSAP